MSVNSNDIAIIGMSGEFPGAKNTKTFWQNLIAGKEGLQRFTQSELLANGVSLAEQNKSHYVPVAGTLTDIDQFAATFFGYAPREAAHIDPQQRKLLEHAWHALEDAALDPARFDGNIGVFVGSSLNTYLLNNILSHPDVEQNEDLQQILFGNGQDYLATRIAYLLNLRGAAINVQTACSTSLVAVHEACQYLLSYQVDAALAGGVSISVPQEKGYSYSIDGMLSPDGHCRPFSADSNGTVFSSGLGIIVLKRLQDAIDAHDPIYAVIKASAINNDGQQKVGYTAPSVDGQAEVIALAQNLAQITPNEIQYVETHGTATALGDAIEIAALQKVYGANTEKQFCALGSLKSNIGHLDVAAGIGGLIKTVLALHHEQIPPSLHCEIPSPKIDWQASPFYVNTTLRPWQKMAEQARYAGVSSFGIGGTNAHVILSDAPNLAAKNDIEKPALIVLSAKTSHELEQTIQQLLDFCVTEKNIALHSLARTLQQGRAEFSVRTACVVSNIQELVNCLREKKYPIVTCTQQLATKPATDIQDCDAEILQALMQAWLQGNMIDWHAHYQNHQPQKLHLPVYPFTRNRYWVERYQAKNAVSENGNDERTNIDDWFYLPSFRQAMLPNTAGETTPTILMFAEPKQATFLRALPIENARIIAVEIADQYRIIDQDHYEMNINELDQFIQLLSDLKHQNALPNHVLHAFSLDQKTIALDYASFSSEQAKGLLSIIRFIQAWEKVCLDVPCKFTLLTNGLNNIANETQVAAHKAPLMAAVKVIPKELTYIQTQLVDIDAFDQPQYAAYQLKLLVRELMKDKYDQEEIIYRGVQRWLRDYVPTALKQPTHAPKVLAQDNVILITGGLGQLGLDIADYFSQAKACKIALLARTKVPDESEWDHLITTMDAEHPLPIMLQRIQAMRMNGAEVAVFSADVSVEPTLLAAIQQVESTLGPITGLVHAAGETVNGIISLKTESSLEESYQAKVLGTYHLFNWFKNKKLNFVVLCSSMNAIIGGLGQLDNTAANIFIDYLADYASSTTGQNIFAINWGAVNVTRPMKVNVLSQFMDLSTEHKKNRMNDDEVNAVYDRLLSYRFGTRIVISTINMNTVLKSWNQVASVEELAKDRPSYQQNVTRLLQDHEVPRTEIECWISERWQQLLGLDAIALTDNFFTIGGHSLAAIQFITKIKETFGIKTHVMNLYELPTLEAFSHYLTKQIQTKTPKSVGL